MTDDLICQAHVTLRSTGTRVDAHRPLTSKLANEFSRTKVQQQVLEDLAVAAYPGQFGAEARYENARQNLMLRRSISNDDVLHRELTEVLQMAYEAGRVAGQRQAITDTAPFMWRSRTEFDL
jgi:hypothetical protein